MLPHALTKTSDQTGWPHRHIVLAHAWVGIAQEGQVRQLSGGQAGILLMERRGFSFAEEHLQPFQLGELQTAAHIVAKPEVQFQGCQLGQGREDLEQGASGEGPFAVLGPLVRQRQAPAGFGAVFVPGFW